MSTAESKPPVIARAIEIPAAFRDPHKTQRFKYDPNAVKPVFWISAKSASGVPPIRCVYVEIEHARCWAEDTAEMICAAMAERFAAELAADIG